MILLSLASRLDQASLRDARGFLARSRGLSATATVARSLRDRNGAETGGVGP